MSDYDLKKLYEGICRQGDLEGAIRELDADTLRELSGYLNRLNVENGIPGLIRGLVIMEASERFLNAKDQAND